MEEYRSDSERERRNNRLLLFMWMVVGNGLSFTNLWTECPQVVGPLNKIGLHKRGQICYRKCQKEIRMGKKDGMSAIVEPLYHDTWKLLKKYRDAGGIIGLN